MENNQFAAQRRVFVNQMEQFLRQKMLPEALSMAEERLARFPGDVDARTFINLVLIETGRIEESRDLLDRIEKDIQRLSFAYLRAADAYREKGLNPDAVLCYQKFLSLNPLAENSPEVTAQIALLQKEEDPDDEVWKSDSADMPRTEFYTLTLADLYIQQGHTKVAADILAEIIKREPSNAQAREKLASVKAAAALKSSPGDAVPSADLLIKTLSCWLENIGGLKKHAT
jgi:thioredoxin-like negative regulator of GroEL